jgi:hypothetical protein
MSAGSRIDEVGAAARQHVEVPAHSRMFEHVRVHRRRDKHRRFRREVQRGQKIVGDAVGELADDICGRGGDDEEIDGGRHRDVLNTRTRPFDVGPGLELVRQHLVPGDRLECQLADEPPSGARHDDHHVVSLLLQTAHDFDGLVGADPAADADSNHGHDARPPQEVLRYR